MQSDLPPAGVFALRFGDSLRAAAFALALRKLVEAARRTTPQSDDLRVWMDHPLTGDGEACCIYVTLAALGVARDAGLDVPPPEPVRDHHFPHSRLAVVDPEPDPPPDARSA